MRPINDNGDGMVKVGVNDRTEAKAAARELRRRLGDNVKTASPAARQHLEAQLEEAEKKLR
jgi:uncharacterized membrane protein YgcG